MADSSAPIRAALGNLPAGLTAKDISAATGLDRSWLSRFKNGELVDPGFTKVDCLRKHLETLGLL